MKFLRVALLLFFCYSLSYGQLVLNEASNRNVNQITDEFDNNPDWIELYNLGNELNLSGYFLSDSKSELRKWQFPGQIIGKNGRVLVFASGKTMNTSATVNHWETAVKDDDTWKWLNPDAATSANWFTPEFDDSGWQTGKGGFGFADNDDNTVFSTSFTSVYSRINLFINDTAAIADAVLHMDYDDAFVAYFNGVEIARANVSGAVSWNSLADNTHEALIYQGQNPEMFKINMLELRKIWKQGKNVLAIHALNQSAASSDLTCRAFLSFGIRTGTNYFSVPPPWFNLQASGTSKVHTNFKIASEGEILYLSNSNGTILDTLAIPGRMPLDASYGRVLDGGNNRGIFLFATPNASNNTQTANAYGMEPNPIINQAAGFYGSSVQVTITSGSTSAEIRYTLDGQTPTKSSNLYTSSFSISATSTLTAKCFSKSGKLPSEAISSTFFINEKPTNAGVMCITTDNENLYGPTGIYDNWWTDWKKPAYIEYFAPGTHLPAFKQRAGIKIDGGAGGSRSQPQRSFRVEPGNGALGDGSLVYPLIPSRPGRAEYDRFYLRNGSNQYLYYPIKDAIETTCMGYNSNTPYSAYTPVQVYLNGRYWGWYELREKQDADFFLQNYGIENEALELLSVSYWYGGMLRSVEGERAVENFTDDMAKIQNLAPEDPNFWTIANSYVDVPNYVDYICMQSWIANTDWPYNNIKIFRGPQTNNKWRYTLVDLEWSLEPNGWTNSYTDHIAHMLNYDASNPYLLLWKKGIANPNFKNYFINRMADLINTNWQIDSLYKIANKIYSETRPEMTKTFVRWGWDATGQLNAFDDAHRRMLGELSVRSANVRNHIQTNFNLPKQVTITLNVSPAGAGKIILNTVKPTAYPWTGIYFEGVPVTVTAKPNTGYTFDYWLSETAIASPDKNKQLTINLTANDKITAHFTGSPQPNKITISEFNYHSDSTRKAGDWIELWNYGNYAVDLSGWSVKNETEQGVFKIPENQILQPGKFLVLCNDTGKFRSQHPQVTNYLGQLNFSLKNSGGSIRLFNEEQKLFLQVNYDDTLAWPKIADGRGRTLELLNPNNSLSDPKNWFAGCMFGSPGTAFQTCPEKIIISEINYNSSNDLDAGDWIEIRNISTETVDVSGWKFRDSNNAHVFNFPAGIQLKTGDNLVVCSDTTLFALIENKIGEFDFGLSSTKDLLRLYNANDQLMYSMIYESVLPWPADANGEGYTLELLDSAGNVNSGTNWFAGCKNGSPGAYYTDCIETETQYNSDNIFVYPNPNFGELNFMLKNLLIEGYRFEIYNNLGRLVESSPKELKQANYTVDINNYESGLYFIRIIYGKNTIQKKFVKM